MEKRKLKLEKSKKEFDKAKILIPRAAQTLSKSPDQFAQGVSPYALKKGKGCYVWDVDGNKYLDLTSSLGAIILGYRHWVVERAVAKQRTRGTIFGLPSELEIILAEKLKEIIPFVDMARFGLNGSDVTAAAIRLARAYTNREHIIKCGYHGWQDWTIATNSMRNKGVPEQVKELSHEFSFNRAESLKEIFDKHQNKIAAVILEPANNAMPNDGFLQDVKDLTHNNGAVLIFDELITGFRLGLGGAAEYFKVEPDLVCYGKAISNGEPFSVLAGKKEIMSELNEVFVSFTYAGYLPSISAAIAVLDFMEDGKVQRKIKETGALLAKNYKEMIREHNLPITVEGFDAHPILSFKNEDGVDNLPLKTLYLQETAKSGILTNCKNFLNYSHNEENITGVIIKTEKIFKMMSCAVKKNKVNEFLECPIVRARYAR